MTGRKTLTNQHKQPQTDTDTDGQTPTERQTKTERQTQTYIPKHTDKDTKTEKDGPGASINDYIVQNATVRFMI